MSATLIQDPSGSTLPTNQESTLSTPNEVYPPTVVQPASRASHSRQSSAAKRKRAQYGREILENSVETAQTEVNGHDKPKRQRLNSTASSEKRTSSTKSTVQDGYPSQKPAEETLQFSEQYVSPWTDLQPNREPAIQSIGVKRGSKQVTGNGPVAQDSKATPESSEQPQGAFPTTPNFKRVFLGNRIIEPWYFSPYPPGDIAMHAFAASIQAFNGEHHHGGRFVKGQSRKTSNMAPQAGTINGQLTNSTAPSRISAKHDTPIHANGISLHVCKRCFAYSDRPFCSPFYNNPHECLATLPGKPVYDDQAPSVEPNLDGAGSFDVSPPSQQHGVPPRPKQEKEKRIRIYEVDPVTNLQHKTFCKNITLFGKFFIDSKSIVFDCSTFLYYIITIVESGDESIAGFFTKEKESVEEYNLACIIVFPPYQQKGLGRLLIQFSYELSKHDGKIGSPEKPLSTLGTRSYSPVWISMVLDYLYEQIAIPHEVLLDRPKANAKRHRNPLGTSRTLKSKEIHESGYSMETHLQFSCTLEQIATGAYLTTSDASFALAELGLQKYIMGFKQANTLGGPKTGSANEQLEGEAVDASQATPPILGPTGLVSNTGIHDQPSTDVMGSSTGHALETVIEPEVPILTRDFIRRLGEKSHFRRKPINKDFVLL